jgi:hypothetical protein
MTGIGVYDNLANVLTEGIGNHQLTYWVSTSAGSGAQVILFSSYIQQFGTSGFNNAGCDPVVCASGTLGALALVSGNNYALSNDHVLGGPLSATQNGATSTNPVAEPGPLDFLCETPPSIGNFFAAPTLDSGVDAALAALNSGQMNATGQIYNIGIPSGVSSPEVGEQVAKQGRSSGLTCGTIQATDLPVSITYEVCGNKKKTFPVGFSDQISITPEDSSYPFTLAGDSGSLIVDAGTARAVGLEFAGGKNKKTSKLSYANPIETVVQALSSLTGETVTLASGSPHSVAGCHFNKPQVILPSAERTRAKAIKQRYEAAISRDPAVIGVGVGAEELNPSKPAIVVLVERDQPHSPIPAFLDGIPVRIIRTDRPEALTRSNCIDRTAQTHHRVNISQASTRDSEKSALTEKSRKD